MSQRGIVLERDIWILLQSVSPAEAAIWIEDKLDAIGDPEFCAIYVECDAAFDWSPDEPRLEALADRSQRWLANRRRRVDGAVQPVQNASIAQFVSTSVEASSPAWDRLIEISRERNDVRR